MVGDPGKSIIKFNNYASKLNSSGLPMGTGE